MNLLDAPRCAFEPRVAFIIRDNFGAPRILGRKLVEFCLKTVKQECIDGGTEVRMIFNGG
ncbi:hypothetical protein [Caballeronia sp. GAWG1-5s-s]|uniref:hypothetical protein n=1 Tax=Caballeronia sp. GAWG1-5s-s TaxID=2921743 RepID=UPI0020294708|nr:hypothetical protein [Caballeronia sp. GAWG1-5s-s]